MKLHSLITIRGSHYCEKARWALDRCHVPYTEKAYMPMMHILPVAYVGCVDLKSIENTIYSLQPMPSMLDSANLIYNTLKCD